MEYFSTIRSSLFNVTEIYENIVVNTTKRSFMKETIIFKSATDYLMLISLNVILLSMGCAITWPQILTHIKKPIGILIGMLSQFGIMPLVAYALLNIINVSEIYATGVLVIASCPGGSLSNTFTYFCDGDVSLSVSMTTFSTLLALGMMPLNVWIYGRNLETDKLVIPRAKMSVSLALITSPIVVGMLLKWRMPKVAHYVKMAGSYVGTLLVIICIVVSLLTYPTIFTNTPGKLYYVAFTLPFLCFTLSFLTATLFKQSVTIRKTIGIECTVQNIPSAITIVMLSFPAKQQGKILAFPFIYGTLTIVTFLVISIMFQIYKCIAKARKLGKVEDGDAKNGDIP